MWTPVVNPEMVVAILGSTREWMQGVRVGRKRPETVACRMASNSVLLMGSSCNSGKHNHFANYCRLQVSKPQVHAVEQLQVEEFFEDTVMQAVVM